MPWKAGRAYPRQRPSPFFGDQAAVYLPEVFSSPNHLTVPVRDIISNSHLGRRNLWRLFREDWSGQDAGGRAGVLVSRVEGRRAKIWGSEIWTPPSGEEAIMAVDIDLIAGESIENHRFDTSKIAFKHRRSSSGRVFPNRDQCGGESESISG